MTHFIIRHLFNLTSGLLYPLILTFVFDSSLLVYLKNEPPGPNLITHPARSTN